jgi:hypothetical protein
MWTLLMRLSSHKEDGTSDIVVFSHILQNIQERLDRSCFYKYLTDKYP